MVRLDGLIKSVICGNFYRTDLGGLENLILSYESDMEGKELTLKMEHFGCDGFPVDKQTGKDFVVCIRCYPLENTLSITTLHNAYYEYLKSRENNNEQVEI